MNFAEKIKEYRVFSISACLFISWMFYNIVMWITSFGLDELNALSAGAGVAISGIFASIAATYKFTYEFSRNREEHQAKEKQ